MRYGAYLKDNWPNSKKSELAIPESYKGYPKLPNILSRCFLAAAHETLSDQGFPKTADIDGAVTAKNRRG
jgi:hypothetical protein